jgi:hypothetical protein
MQALKLFHFQEAFKTAAFLGRGLGTLLAMTSCKAAQTIPQFLEVCDEPGDLDSRDVSSGLRGALSLLPLPGSL